jgi:glycosyltransferase involved in cell wall biosynthesis
MHLAIITAGGAGMFCGSCMHDNTWARALIAAGHEASLVPTYTPIRVDEPNQSERQVFFGGLNVYLRSQHAWWGKLPGWVTRWLDRPGLIRWATRFSVSNAAAQLGRLTLDMLAGETGPHAQAGADLARHITQDLRPDAVIFSNALLVGALRRLRQEFCGPIFCTLQGDDVFLDGLPEMFRERAIAAISQRSRDFDGFLVHSRFYRDYIAQYLRFDADRFHLLPLSIDPAGHDGRPGERAGRPFTVGYFARIAPEKGLHHLVQAFALLHARHPDARLKIGGYLGPQHRDYFAQSLRPLKARAAAWEYSGSPVMHEAKSAFYRSLDVLSVPTEFLEPKGLYVLEALANGVPVVQPEHGAFPELIAATGGGLLVPPRDPSALADALQRLRSDVALRAALGAAGQTVVRERFSLPALAEATLQALKWQPEPPSLPAHS